MITAIRTSLTKTGIASLLPTLFHRTPTPSSARSMAVAATKREVRTAVQRALKRLSEEEMAAESGAIAARVIAAPFFQTARRLAIYVHCAKLREVDTTAILDNAFSHTGATIYVPRVQDSDANMHLLHLDSTAALRAVPPFGIREPPPTYADGSLRADVLHADEPLDLVVMPGLAFDAQGQRLGRGGGYYDKFIAGCKRRAEEQGWDRPLLVALSYQVQLVESVPVEAMDENVDVIVTATEVLGCSERGKGLLER